MSSTLVNLVSDQMVPIILGAMHYQPNRIIYVRSRNPLHQRNVSRINRFLQRFISIDYEEVIVDPFNIEDILGSFNNPYPVQEMFI